MTAKWVWIVMAAGVLPLTSACAMKPSDGATSSLQTVSSARVSSVPFDLYMGLVFLDVRVNDSSPLSFNLDSGLQVSVLDSAQAKRLGLPLRDRTTAKVPGGSVELAFADGVRLGLKGLDLPPRTVRTLPLSIFEPVLGRPIEGTLGHDIFTRYVVEIDYVAEVINLYDPNGYSYSGGGEVLPLSLEEDQAFVHAEILQPGRAPTPAKLKIDTGSADALGLNGSFVASTKLIAAGQRVTSSPGVALGGITENYVVKLAGLRLGRLLFSNVVAGYSKDLTRGGDAGTMGGEVLRRFNVVFDYSRKRLILEPNRHFGEPFAWDASGLFLVSNAPGASELKVLRVTAGTPAAESGVRDGDVILLIDGEAPISLEQVRRRLTRAGERRRLTIRRGATPQEIELVLRSLI